MSLLKKPSVRIFLLVLLVYVFFARRGLDGGYMMHESDYFSHLASSFLEGRLDLINPGNTHDLSFYNGKMYLYWGPTPVLAIIPFLLIFGFNFSDCLYTAILGSLASLIVYLIFNQINRIGWTNLDNFKKGLLSVFWGLGTVYFVTSTMGGVWFTSQAIATLYCLVSLYFLFRTGAACCAPTINVLLSGLFLVFAIIARNTFVFYLPFFLTVLWFMKKKLVLFLVPVIFLLFLNGSYNYARFGSVLENGHTYHNAASGFKEDKENYGTVNSRYISRNLHYMIFNLPKLTSKFPYFEFDGMGNSFLFLSPLLFLVFLVNKYNWSKREFKVYNFLCVSTILVIAFSLLNYFSTGYLQFNYRYALDFLPLLILLLGQVAGKISNKILVLLTFFSVCFNMMGMCSFIKCGVPAVFPWVTLFLGLLLGILVVQKLSFYIKNEFKLFYAIPIGFILLTAVVYFVTNLVGINYGWIVGLFITAVGLTFYLVLRKPEIGREMFYGFFKDKILVSLLIIVGVVSWVMFDGHVLKNINGDLYVGESTYGDLPFHLGIISEMTYGDIFPPENPIFRGVDLVYPYFVNLFSAVLVKGGWSLRDSIVYPGMILMMSLTVLIYEFVLTLTKSRLAAFLATILYFFHGGAGFYYFFKDNGFNLSNMTKDYSHLFDRNIQWANFITRMMVPERSLLFGIPAGIIILRLLVFRGMEKLLTVYEGAVAAILIGLMPIMHTHTALTFALVLPFLCLVKLKKRIWKRQLVRYFLVAGVATMIFLPFLPMFIGHVESSTGFFKIHLWWMRQASEAVWFFWLKNTYLYIPVSLLALIFVKNRDIKLLQVAGLILFIILNVVQFSPFDWDNVKFLFWAGLFWAAGAGALFTVLLKRNVLVKLGVLLLFFSMIFSALLSLNREINLKFVLFDKETVELGDFIKENTKKDSVFLTYFHHNSPASALAGRPILMGYQGSLWVHGIKYGEREKDIIEMFGGGENALNLMRKYKVDYVILERGNPDFKIDRSFFERFPVVYKDNNHFLYEIN